MLIKRAPDIPSSEITDKKLYINRRAFMRAAVGTAATAAAGLLGTQTVEAQRAQPAPHGRQLENIKSSPFSTTEPKNPWLQITTYNNFLEFGPNKESAAIYAKSLKTAPWSVAVEGECHKPAVWSLEDILKGQTLEERIYRHRCV